MATKHWVRDVNLQDPTAYIAGGNHNRANAVLYHFLRVAGWEWLWECDGNRGPHAENPSHVPDGNMQLDGVANWAAVNTGTRAKDTSIVHSGEQSLKIDALAAGDGVESASLTDMKAPGPSGSTGTGDSLSSPVNGIMEFTENGNPFSVGNELLGATIYFNGSVIPANDGYFPIVHHFGGSNDKIGIFNPAGTGEGYITPNPPTTPGYVISYSITYRYEIVLWAYNAADAWDVLVDPGTGAFGSVGTIPNNGGVWTRYHFTFHVTGGGAVKLRILSSGVGADTVYIGGVQCFRSSFEWMASDEGYTYSADASNIKGTAGVLTNPDRFSTAEYTLGPERVGQHLFVWDPTNNKNSGCYEIVADLGGGVIQVNMRSPTATFTTQTGLVWRIVNIQNFTSGGCIPNSPMPEWQQSAGFGLESPHTSKWRFFARQNQSSGQTVKNTQMWTAPEDTDFDFSSGTFYQSGPSVMRNRADHWVRNVGGGGISRKMHGWRGLYTYFIGTTVSRTFIMTDEDGAFFHFVHYSTHNDQHGCHLQGYLGSSPQHPGIMTFYQFAPWESVSGDNEIYFDDDYRHFGAMGTGYDENGLARRATLGQLGYGNAAEDALTQTNKKANPFSGREWLHVPFIGLDPEGDDNVGGEMDGDDCGVYQGRTDIAADLSTFDSDQYLHFDSGLVWEWSGEGIL